MKSFRFMAMSTRNSVLQKYDSIPMSVRMTIRSQLQLKLVSRSNINICQLWNCQIKRLAQSKTRDLNKYNASTLTKDGVNELQIFNQVRVLLV